MAAFRIPSLRRNKTTDRAVVTLNSRDIYLGRWGSAIAAGRN